MIQLNFSTDHDRVIFKTGSFTTSMTCRNWKAAVAFVVLKKLTSDQTMCQLLPLGKSGYSYAVIEVSEDFYSVLENALDTHIYLYLPRYRNWTSITAKSRKAISYI